MFSVASLKVHHKSKEANARRFFLVRWYYGSYPFFGYCCVGAELTYMTLYIRAHAQNTFLLDACNLGLKLFLPACVVKQIVNIFQLTSACHAVASNDADVRNKIK
jgi:CDP-diacylglycerol--inositol 3-phosphatidyltransferase